MSTTKGRRTLGRAALRACVVALWLPLGIAACGGANDGDSPAGAVADESGAARAGASRIDSSGIDASRTDAEASASNGPRDGAQPSGDDAEPRGDESPRPTNGASARPAHPNVLFISIDDLRPELGCYGSRAAVTPHLDRLAAEGVRFDRAYAQVSLCNPSRASVLTGCRPLTTQVVDLKTHFRAALPDVRTLPQHFRLSGYRCASLGKVYHGNLFDEPSWSEEAFVPPRSGMYALDENSEAHKPRAKGPPTERAAVDDDAYRDGQLTRRAIEWLGQAGDAPFFLALGFYKPHLPLAAPTRDWDRHSLESIELPPNRAAPQGAPACALRHSGELQQYSGVPPDEGVSDALARELIRAYHSCVTFVDRQVGEVLAELERLDLARDTIVVVWSDHGWYLGEHGQWAKMGVRELGLRTTLLVRVPGEWGGAGGVSCDAQVELLDLYPTLCEVAGLALPAHLEGVSFAPALRGEAFSGKRAVFGEHHGPRERAFSVRTRELRLNVWREVASGGEVGLELYDLADDPGEDRNLAFEPARAADVAALRAELARLWPHLAGG